MHDSDPRMAPMQRQCHQPLSPLPRRRTVTTFSQPFVPSHKIINYCRSESAPVPSSRANVHVCATSKPRRNPWPRSTPVHEIVTNQDSIYSRVVDQIVSVRPSVSVTVMRITLMPSSRSVPAVDVVAKRLLLASAKVGTFPPEPRARPVLIKGHSLRHPHNIDHDIAPVLRAASCPDNQVAYVRQSSYLWLTGCQSAHAKERVWGESVIPSNNIRVQAHEQILEKNILRSRLSPHADIPLLAIGLDVQWFVPDAPLPKPANTPPSDNPRTRVCWANGAVPPADAPRTTPTARSRCQPSDPGAVTVDPDSAEAGRLR